MVALAHVEPARIIDVGGVGHIGRLLGTDRAAAAGGLLEGHASLMALGDVEEGAAVRSEQPFVGREHDEIRIDGADVERQDADRLRGVEQQGRAACAQRRRPRPRSTTPPSDQCTDEIEASATGAAPGRAMAVSTASVQSPLPGRLIASTVKPPVGAREVHSSTGEA